MREYLACIAHENTNIILNQLVVVALKRGLVRRELVLT